MTKAQALAALTAMESAKLAGSAILSYPGGAESWTIELDHTTVYTGAQIDAVYQYAQANGLALTAVFSEFGLT